MSAAEWVAKRRELLDAATEGPWFQGREGHRYESAHEVYSKREPDEEDSHDIASYVWSAEDAALMVDARASLPRALDTLEAVLEFATAERDKISRTYISQPDTAYAGYANAMHDVIRTIEAALGGES